MIKIDEIFGLLLEKIDAYEDLEEEYKEKKLEDSFKMSDNLPYLVKLSDAADSIRKDYKDILLLSLKEDLFFELCAFKTYQYHYERLKEEYLEYNFESTEQDFIQGEIEQLNKHYYYPEVLNDQYISSHKRKIEFLNKKLEAIQNGEDLKTKAEKTRDSATPFYSVHLLQELGVIDFLKDQRGIGYTKQCEIIAKLTGKSLGNIKTKMSNRGGKSFGIKEDQQLKEIKHFLRSFLK